MSRIGRKPIVLEKQVDLNFNSSNGIISVKGPLGQLERTLPTCVKVAIENGEVNIAVDNPEDKFQKSIWGTIRAVVSNMVDGVSKGFSKEMELNGVGYRMELGQELVLYIGFSHPVRVQIPASIKLNLTKNVLSGTSIDKELIGNFFSTVHNMKPCDVYKHKGFKFPNRFYRKKVGKKGK